AALGVAVFPNDPGDPTITTLGIFQLSTKVSNRIHVVSAGAHFVTLACMSRWLFTRTDKSKPMTDQKKERNKWYRRCAYIMFLALAYIVVAWWRMSDQQTAVWRPTLVGETVALVAFGVSWIIKGEWILKDEQLHV